MKIKEQRIYQINEQFLCYLIYGDPTMLEEKEIEAIDRFIDALTAEGFEYEPCITHEDGTAYDAEEPIDSCFSIDEIMHEWAQCLYLTFYKRDREAL